MKDVKHEKIRGPLGDPLEVFPRGLRKIYSAWVTRTYPFASIGRDVSIHFTSKVSRKQSPRIILGNAVRLLEYAWLNVPSDDPANEPAIVIDDNCSIGYGTIISGKNCVHLERDVLVGQHVVIQDHSHAYENIEVPIINQGATKGGKIRIGEGSWIGRGAAILCSRGELNIGRHCVVSANSVVMQSVPDYSVVFGMPAAIIRQYDPQARVWCMGPLRGARAGATKRLSAKHKAELLEESLGING